MSDKEPTSLYLVPTPIGNLEDITLRALTILKSVNTILAEDTRTSGHLLKHYEINKPVVSHHAFNEHKTIDHLIKRMRQGEVFALISDAGTPGISDPGFLLARACVQEGVKIECLPGATAFVPALLKSGLPADRFTFEGFLPQKKGRHTMLTSFLTEERTIIFYESPHRLLKTLEQFVTYFGEERRISVSREISKMFEETFNGTIPEVLRHFAAKTVKGEIVMVLEGAKVKKKKESKYEDQDDQEEI
ncbi:MAG: rRNA ((1402)-2-O)-methyltransferase [Bacteroidota bacterium]